ncbi:MAG TPA: tRNA (adenosine(37)-N6)-threonylcarbamoyltransferase complex transferase subunit TsaD [Chlamydiales bacterium]|nr:tRNA (adenosine(37)-N6)-threonylcarbamoyltransferase complex transferase subunit TsaD [Chlamydiales bacterium]
MKVLGIETTCDETGASVVIDGQTILSNVIASSIDIHERYGGVFPELASRRHLESILPVVTEALEKANTSPEEIDLIAVAISPGLIGSLLVGLQFAKGLSIAWNKPWIGVDHVEAHLYAAMMGKPLPTFPALGLVLSGGHTLLLKINDLGDYTLLSTTVDDAIGEAFDKVAALLGLPYPGGPHVEALAKQGLCTAYPLKPGKVKLSPLDFSFSGLKTSILYAAKGQNAQEPRCLSLQEKADLAASFQETAFQDVIAKSKIAIERFPCGAIYLGGGVCNNQHLRTLFYEAFPSIPVHFPSFDLTLDNGAMIAGLGYHKFLKKPISDPLDLEARTRNCLKLGH